MDTRSTQEILKTSTDDSILLEQIDEAQYLTQRDVASLLADDIEQGSTKTDESFAGGHAQVSDYDADTECGCSPGHEPISRDLSVTIIVPSDAKVNQNVYREVYLRPPTELVTDHETLSDKKTVIDVRIEQPTEDTGAFFENPFEAGNWSICQNEFIYSSRRSLYRCDERLSKDANALSIIEETKKIEEDNLLMARVLQRVNDPQDGTADTI